MATTPPALPTVSVAVLDPISADLQAVLAAYTATCNLYMTPAGQKLLEAQIAAGNTMESAIAKAWSGFLELFKK